MYTKSLELTNDNGDIKLIVKETTVKVNGKNPVKDNVKVVILLMMLQKSKTDDHRVETVFYKKVKFVQRENADATIIDMVESAEEYYKIVKEGKILLFKFTPDVVEKLSSNFKF